MNETDAPNKHHESIIQGSKAVKIRRPGSGRQLRIVLYVFLIIAVAISAAYFLLKPEVESLTIRNYVSTAVEIQTIQDDLQLGGTVRARTETTIEAPVAGILESLAVDVGSWVTAGQAVAVLDAEELRNAYETHLQNLVQSTRAFDTMLLVREQALLISGRTREDLEETLNNALKDLANSRELHKIGSITATALDEAEGLAANSEHALEDHDEDADIAARFHELSRLDSEDNLQAIRESIKDLEEQIQETTVISEIEGRVVWTIDTISAVGKAISQNASIMQIADTLDPFIETVIEEQYISDIRLGQEVRVTISGQVFPGEIERIGLLAAIPPDGGPPQVDLDISVDVEDFEALPGGTALVELIVGVVPDAMVLPRGPFLSTGNRVYLYKIDGVTAIRTRVTFGAITEQYVEIISGINLGDHVITSSYQNFIDFEIVTLGEPND
ncbi:MAG: HlyD family efflux transporter periplasmic adaptor subunit [Spirochaetales bacterium]|jgi:HlyD family secretion protein|nr:HlyD family efflux transporter periplasmic adaptor subunit [Spirochaetales bacterium]